MGVRAQQQGIGGPVVDDRGAHVDPVVPAVDAVTEVGAIGQVEQHGRAARRDAATPGRSATNVPARGWVPDAG